MTGPKQRVWVFLLIALFTVSALGCASTDTAKPLAVKDLSSLAGKWSGWVTVPGGGSESGTWDLSPNGNYGVRAGGFSAQGVAQIKDGTLTLTSTSTAGGLSTGERTSTASVSERGDTLVVKGNGRSDAGPFSFEFTRKK